MLVKTGVRGQMGTTYRVVIERYRTVTERAVVTVEGAASTEAARMHALDTCGLKESVGPDWDVGEDQVSECIVTDIRPITEPAIIRKKDAVERPVHVPGISIDEEGTTTTDMG